MWATALFFYERKAHSRGSYDPVVNAAVCLREEMIQERQRVDGRC
jgi:hypothetical protein